MVASRSVRRRALVALSALSLVALVSCSSDSEGGGSEGGGGGGGGGGAQEAADVAVGMAMAGPSNDGGFNQTHFEGLEAAEADLGIESNFVENASSPESAIQAMQNLAADNDLVIGVGAEFDEAGKVAAAQYPDVTFMVVNGSVDPELDNLFVYGVRQGVPAYIGGVVAASLPDVDLSRAAFIGGLEIPPVTQAGDAFVGAVEATAPDAEATSVITGSFTDVAGTKSAGAAQIAAGAEVIYGLADPGFQGVYQAAEEDGSTVYLMSSPAPRCGEYDLAVGTGILQSDKLVVSMITDFIEDSVPDEPLFYGVEDPEIQRFELCPDFATPELEQLVEDTTAGIVDGSITLPEGV